MSKKEIIKALEDNIKLVDGWLKDRHTRDFKIELKGLKAGYEFAIALLKK